MKSGDLKHVCDIYSPGTEPDTRGQEGGRVPYMAGVPCSIEPVQMSEQEASRQIYGTQVTRVKLYGNPKKPLTLKHYLMVGNRQLNIAEILDKNQNGIELELTCGEEVA